MGVEELIIPILSLAGTIIGTFAGIVTSAKLSNYRLEQLEKKVEAHNSISERTVIIEQELKMLHKVVDSMINRKE